MDTIKNICDEFNIIRLDEMDKVKLMDRKEKKFTLHRDRLPLILEQLKEDYDILEIEGQKLMPYKSVYFDTPDFELYRYHQNGKLNRYKVRNRIYELTGVKYLEIKFKNNKKRTIKQRIKLSSEKEVEESSLFIKGSLPPSLQSLEEKLVVRYKRIMLVDRSRKERVTIDVNLNCSTFNRSSSYKDMVIIEIKHEGEFKDSPLGRNLYDKKIKDISFSKYCLGIADHCPDVKTNMMKVKMRKIENALKLQVS